MPPFFALRATKDVAGRGRVVVRALTRKARWGEVSGWHGIVERSGDFSCEEWGALAGCRTCSAKPGSGIARTLCHSKRMTIPSTNEPEILRAQGEVVSVARGILSGSVGIVEGSRRLSMLGHALGVDRDPDFTFFVGLESETDHLPVGEIRCHWADDALRRTDEELLACESFYRGEAFRVCQSLIQQYDKTVDKQ